jgi:peptidoglycan/xylan/chitin deacetylase (PgdA/CDA1 family)
LPDARAHARAGAIALAAAGTIALLPGCVAGGASAHRRPAPRPQAHKAAARTTAPECASTPTTRAETAGIARLLRHTPYIRRGGTKREIALTFDDGPSAFTPAVLRILAAKHVPATFFVVGYSVRTHRDALHAEERARMPIGDHTMTHPFMDRLSPAAQSAQVGDLAAAIARCPQLRPRLFRPPYGAFNATTLRILRRERMLMVLWSIDPSDYARPGAGAIAARVLGNAHPGAIVLLHDGGGPRSETVAALPAIIDGLRKRGYRLVSVPRLVLDDPPPANQPPPRALSSRLRDRPRAAVVRRRHAGIRSRRRHRLRDIDRR